MTALSHGRIAGGDPNKELEDLSIEGRALETRLVFGLLADAS